MGAAADRRCNGTQSCLAGAYYGPAAASNDHSRLVSVKTDRVWCQGLRRRQLRDSVGTWRWTMLRNIPRAIKEDNQAWTVRLNPPTDPLLQLIQFTTNEVVESEHQVEEVK